MINQTGVITHQIMEKIVKADLIIAILTYGNPNVFYELALCHVARKPFIQMIEKDKDIPFDTSHVRTIHYSLTDITTYRETEKKLENLVNNYAEGETGNPISLALDALKLQESKEPFLKITAETFDKIQTIDNRMGLIHNLIVRLASQRSDSFYYIDDTFSAEIVDNPPKKLDPQLENILKAAKYKSTKR
jgi:hypothetical protein